MANRLPRLNHEAALAWIVVAECAWIALVCAPLHEQNILCQGVGKYCRQQRIFNVLSCRKASERLV